MDLSSQLNQQLKRLRLSGILDTLDVRINQAVEQKLGHREFLLQVTTDEVDRREHKKLATRLRRVSGVNYFDRLTTIIFTDPVEGCAPWVMHRLGLCRVWWSGLSV